MRLKVEVADNPITLAHGLMGRKKMPIDHGMVFKFPHYSNVSFWGKNTYIPLDIAFIDRNNRIAEIKHIAPMSTRMVTSSQECNTAIEANSGFFRNNNIKPGDLVEIKNLDSEPEVIFTHANDN